VKESIQVLMSERRAVRLKLVLFSLLGCAGCGDTFRPVATPLLPSPQNPAATHSILMLISNGLSPNLPSNPGASSHIDVSGDTNVGVAPLGLGPVHATLTPNNSRLYVANSLDDTVSSFSPTSISPVTTTSLPAGSMPVFVHTTENATVYVANFGSNSVAAISTTTNVVTNTLPIPVGNRPVALAETSDGAKLYAVNESDGTVTSIDTATQTVLPTSPIPTGAAPVWALARPDAVQVRPVSFRVYVLNSGSGTLSAIDTAKDMVIGNTPVGAGANFMVYDKTRTRLYVINPSTTSVMVLDASIDPPAPVAPSIDLTAAPAGATSLCATGCHPVSITVLADGTRAYVGSYALVIDTSRNPPAPAIEWQVSVVNLQTNTVRSVLPADPATTLIDVDTVNPTGCGSSPFGPSPLPFRLSVVAAADGSKVYVASCDSGRVEIISTFDDSLVSNPGNTAVLSLPAPPSTFQSAKVNITAASPNGGSTTYSYSLTAGPPLQVGEDIVITGMADAGNNGIFAITALGAGTFTAANPSGVTANGQAGSGNVTSSPPQNPVFMLAGP
jgi:YVTN family beta-propeller protein